jgi:hypothetical protein
MPNGRFGRHNPNNSFRQPKSELLAEQAAARGLKPYRVVVRQQSLSRDTEYTIRAIDTATAEARARRMVDDLSDDFKLVLVEEIVLGGV